MRHRRHAGEPPGSRLRIDSGPGRRLPREVRHAARRPGRVRERRSRLAGDHEHADRLRRRLRRLQHRSRRDSVGPTRHRPLRARHHLSRSHRGEVRRPGTGIGRRPGAPRSRRRLRGVPGSAPRRGRGSRRVRHDDERRRPRGPPPGPRLRAVESLRGVLRDPPRDRRAPGSPGGDPLRHPRLGDAAPGRSGGYADREPRRVPRRGVRRLRVGPPVHRSLRRRRDALLGARPEPRAVTGRDQDMVPGVPL